MGKILVLENTEVFSEVEIEENEVTYENISACLDGGYIERVTFNKRLAENNIDVFVDEEGKLKGLEAYVVVFDLTTDKIIEVLAGKLVFVGRRGSESIPLTDEQVKIVYEVLNEVLNVVGQTKNNGPYRLLPYR